MEKKQFQISIFVSKKAAVSKKTTLLSENNAGKNAPQKLRQIDWGGFSPCIAD